MAKIYGKSALSATLIAPDFSKYLEKVEAAGNSIDDAAKAAVDAALPIVEKSMIAGAERHRDKGDVVRAIETEKAHVEGNLIVGSVGIDPDKHPEAIHAAYQEYGDGHSPEFPDPFIRPAIDNNRKEILKAERAVLKAKGVPVD